MKKEEFLEKLFNREHKSHSGLPVWNFIDSDEIRKRSIIELLGLKRKNFSEEAILMIDILENDQDLPYVKYYHNLKWKVLALYNVQDGFSGVVHTDGYNHDVFFARHYFYYEALHLLREYFYCGFNNFLSGAQHLLRTFVEFNIKQCYYTSISWKESSYRRLNDYLKTGVSPSNLAMINSYFPSGSFAKPIKKKIQIILAQLSNTSSHAYSPSNSNRGKGSLHHEYSINTMYFWMSLHHSINAVLWSYYILNPNIFFPKDVLRKFGFNYPIGTYVQDFQFESVKQSLSKQDFKMFLEYASKTQEVKDLEHFYQSQSDKSDTEITATWNEDDDMGNFEIGYVKLIAKQRALNEYLASKCTMEEDDKTVDVEKEALMDQIFDYSWWKKNYKRM